MPTTRNLAILIFEDVEVLNFCGPFEVFTVASRFTDQPAFHVFTVAEKPGPVLTCGGLSVNPHHRLGDCPSLLPTSHVTRIFACGPNVSQAHARSYIRWSPIQTVCGPGSLSGRSR